MYQKVKADWRERVIPLSRGITTKDRTGYYLSKRVLDLVLTISALLILAPVTIIIALLIRLDSTGPVIFCQTRVGVKRRSHKGQTVWKPIEFTCYKFRTMIHNSDPSVHKAFVKDFVEGCVENSDNGVRLYKLHDDSRITRVGRGLRKMSLDELPQLINILLGEMSLVGPRPDVPYSVKHYQTWHHERLTASPGLTGLWQVKGRCTVTFDEMVEMDIEYIRNQSLLLDLKIMFLTIPTVLSRHGAV